MKNVVCILLVLFTLSSIAQTKSKNFRTKTFKVEKDTILLDSVSINPYKFKVFTSDKVQIDSINYKVDFSIPHLILDAKKYPEIIVEYYALPEFLTKTYSLFDEKIIVPKRTQTSKLYSLQKKPQRSFFKPFDGLTTSGSLSRGITVGNNQDAVLNSNFDLQITGNLSDKVKLRASITDTNIPLQESGYSQRLNEFDRVFIELFSNNWSIKAGDVNLSNTVSNFMKFNKKVSGVEVNATINHKNSATKAFASGAIVRGQFARNTIVAQDANQGPYKITANNSEELILIISDSETVYVNGVPLKRGENNDYTINYNTGEITFNPTYPVNASMRIIVEYQFSDRNYTRFVTYNGAQYQSDKFSVGFNFYNENDAKNQSLQQDLSDSQKQILAEAGDDVTKMIVPSAIAKPYSENTILYKKEQVNGVEAFVFSTNENDELFSVRFKYVGANQGNYVIETSVATGRIYKYVAPINNIPQGEYEPVVQLIAPNKLQIATVSAAYKPTNKTKIATEFAFSNNDENLFSNLDDGNNEDFAGKIELEQLLVDKTWKLGANANVEFVNKNFRTIQRIRNIEFNRDWDLINPKGNQRFTKAGLFYEHPKKGVASYNFEQLRFSENFNGTKHNIFTDLKLKNLKIAAKGSLLDSENETSKTHFLRFYSSAKQYFNKKWIGVRFNTGNRDREEVQTATLSALNHKFTEYEAFAGIGDTTKVFAEFGFNYRVTDSVKLNNWQRVNTARTYFLKSQLIKNENSNLTVYASYRNVDATSLAIKDALNSRLQYNQQLFKNEITLNTAYETNSGTLPQQEYNYAEVEPGRGYYTWIDYNNNKIQELNEFEVAKFPDEARYVRVLLPTVRFLRTYQNKFSQAVTLNPSLWRVKKGFRKFLSHFMNQTSVLIDSKNSGSKLILNPFDIDDALSLQMNLRNSLFYNRGKQRYSTIYTYLNNKNKTAFSVDVQETNLESHQLQFIHKLNTYFLFDVTGSKSFNKTSSESFVNRNYSLKNHQFTPKLAYLYSKNARFEVFYSLKDKQNRLENFEKLHQQNIGFNVFFSNKQKSSIIANGNVFFNDFEGNQNSPVGFQMLEGLQPGTNFTWSLNFQRKITSYLDVNLNYLGRKSPTAKAIHTGTVQLRATF